MKLYLLRHGTTQWNRIRKLQGRSDIPLAEEGRDLARIVARALADVNFAAAYTSPLSRARETAQILVGERATPLVEDARLVELSFGVAEGEPLLQPTEQKNPAANIFSDPLHYVPPEGGESYASLLRRCEEFTKEIIRPKMEKNGNLLVVAHGCVVRAMFDALLGSERAAEVYGQHVQRNCAINIFSSTGDDFVDERVAWDCAAEERK